MASRPLTPVSNDLAISCRNSSEDYPPETSERECHLSPSQSVESDFAYYEYSIWNEHSAKNSSSNVRSLRASASKAKLAHLGVTTQPNISRKKQPASSNLLDYFNDLLRALPGSRRKPVDADPAVPPNESPTTASSSAAIAIKRSDFFDQTSAFARELSPTGLRRPGSFSYTTHRRRSHRISFYNRSVRSSRYGAEENASAAAENFSETESKLDLESIATGTEVDGGDRELDRTPSESDMPDDTQSIEDDDQGVLDSDHDGWKSFIEWRNGIERLGQPNEVESPPSISETESKTSEDLNISDNDGVSLYTVRGVKGDDGVAPDLLPGAISEPEVGSRNDETNLPLALFNLERWLQSLSPRGFEFYPPKKSLPLVSLSENIVPSHNFGIVRQRSRSETRGKILPAFWEGVPLSFFKNGVYLAITGTSHVNSAKSLDPTSILSAIGRRLEYTSYTVTLKILRPQISPFSNSEPLFLTLTRRYSEFHALFVELVSMHTQDVKKWPEFPQRILFGRFHPEIIYQRISAFSALLNFIALHPILYNSPPVLKFIGYSDGIDFLAAGSQQITDPDTHSHPTFIDSALYRNTSRGVLLNRRSFSNPIH